MEGTRMKRLLMLCALCASLVAAAGCVSTRGIFEPESSPLKEYTLQGSGKEKVLLVPIDGFISDMRNEGFLQSSPSMLQEVVAALRKAARDKAVRAVVLKIDSPGGTVTASDLLYEEIREFGEKTGVTIVVSMMSVAASGGYYIALPADHIVAHPTTVTGSVGVLFVQPKVAGLMDKIGVEVEVSKSGEMKDMGSPYRQSTEEETRIMEGLTEKLGKRFIDLVAEHRKLDGDRLKEVASARVYLAGDALELGLVDSLGAPKDAIAKAKELARIPNESRVIVYRRKSYADDNLYNTAVSAFQTGKGALVDFGLPDPLFRLKAGFYYLWIPGTRG
jgi:protease-4